MSGSGVSQRRGREFRSAVPSGLKHGSGGCDNATVYGGGSGNSTASNLHNHPMERIFHPCRQDKRESNECGAALHLKARELIGSSATPWFGRSPCRIPPAIGRSPIGPPLYFPGGKSRDRSEDFPLRTSRILTKSIAMATHAV